MTGIPLTTEAEWLACTEPRWMMTCALVTSRHRKLRLFAADCCRRVWRCLSDDRLRQSVEAVEQYADGALSPEEWAFAVQMVNAIVPELDSAYLNYPAERMAGFAIQSAMNDDSWMAAIDSNMAHRQAKAAIKQEELHRQARLLRCLFGNPFRPVSVAPGWLMWNGRTVVRLAQPVYDGHAFDRLPILADAPKNPVAPMPTFWTTAGERRRTRGDASSSTRFLG